MGEKGNEMIGLMLHTRVARLVWKLVHEVSTKFVKEVE